jgi:hypothetical protein
VSGERFEEPRSTAEENNEENTKKKQAVQETTPDGRTDMTHLR